MHDLADLPETLERAFAVFDAGRPRPVHIQIPLDLWSEPAPALPAGRHGGAAARPLAGSGGRTGGGGRARPWPPLNAR
ncbi:MAG: thiamine pyrophosphate-binding protein [Rhodovibrio sp.]|nr:thiamine pyrophosphate-binding protein [Rhodovibrio sp.]